MKTLNLVALGVLAVVAVGSVRAAEYFVDSETGDDARDGRSAATATNPPRTDRVFLAKDL